MTRALVAVGAALTLFIGGLVAVVYLSRDEEGIGVDSPLAEEITRQITLSDRVDLAAVARFDWDTVLIAARAAPPQAISARLGYEWTGEGQLFDAELLIFLRRGRVVRFADYRGGGRFSGFREPVDALPRDRAVLRVRDLVISPDRGAPG